MLVTVGCALDVCDGVVCADASASGLSRPFTSAVLVEPQEGAYSMADYDDDEEEEEDETQQSEIEWGDAPRRKRFTDSRSAFVLEVRIILQ